MKITIHQNSQCDRDFHIDIPNINNVEKCKEFVQKINSAFPQWGCDDMIISFRYKFIGMRFSFFGEKKDLKPRKLIKELREFCNKYFN